MDVVTTPERGHAETFFSFDPKRTSQAAAVLIRFAGGRENFTKLLKLLYLADRHALLEVGQTITGDAFVNMKNGPVLSRTYNCIKEEPRNETWADAIRRDGFFVELSHDPGDSLLSDYDVGVLEDLAKKHRAHDYSKMIDIVHELPEWSDPAPAKVSPLSVIEVMRKAGVSEDDIANRVERLRYLRAVNQALHVA